MRGKSNSPKSLKEFRTQFNCAPNPEGGGRIREKTKRETSILLRIRGNQPAPSIQADSFRIPKKEKIIRGKEQIHDISG